MEMGISIETKNLLILPETAVTMGLNEVNLKKQNKQKTKTAKKQINKQTVVWIQAIKIPFRVSFQVTFQHPYLMPPIR